MLEGAWADIYPDAAAHLDTYLCGVWRGYCKGPGPDQNIYADGTTHAVKQMRTIYNLQAICVGRGQVNSCASKWWGEALWVRGVSPLGLTSEMRDVPSVLVHVCTQ